MSITPLTDNRMNAANAAIKCALSLNGIDSFNKVRRGMVKRLIRKDQWLDTSINSKHFWLMVHNMKRSMMVFHTSIENKNDIINEIINEIIHFLSKIAQICED